MPAPATAEKTTDIRPHAAALYLLPVQTRVPLKFGTETLTSVTCARVHLQVRDRAGVIQEARLNDVSQVNVFGSVQVTSAAVEGLCQSEKPIAYFSFGGWFYALTQGLSLKNVFLPSGDRAKDTAAEGLLQAQLTRLQHTLQLPPRTAAPADRLLNEEQLPLRVAFSGRAAGAGRADAGAVTRRAGRDRSRKAGAARPARPCRSRCAAARGRP